MEAKTLHKMPLNNVLAPPPFFLQWKHWFSQARYLHLQGLIFNADSVRSLHHNDRQGEATVHYRFWLFNLLGEASVSLKEATPFALTVLVL